MVESLSARNRMAAARRCTMYEPPMLTSWPPTRLPLRFTSCIAFATTELNR